MENMTLKQSVLPMANKFLNAIESPVMETCSDILQVTNDTIISQKKLTMTCRADEQGCLHLWIW